MISRDWECMMRMYWFAMLVAIGTLYACLPAPLTNCGDGTSCAQPTVCVFANNNLGKQVAVCAGPDSASQCSKSNINEPCMDEGRIPIAGTICVKNVEGQMICAASRCGDGKVLGGENCDDGNVFNGDGCSSDCVSNETCGNNIIDGKGNGKDAEQCDEGIAGLSGDGCSSRCMVEADVWTKVSPVPFPAVSNHAMAYDQGRGVTVLFFYDSQFGGQTWEFDGIVWSLRPINSPSQLFSSTMVYDAGRKVMVMLGRPPSSDVNQTWEFDGVRWLQRLAKLSQREDFAMAYDSKRARTVVFGGFSSVDAGQTLPTYLNEVWEYDGVAWRRNAASPPPIRSNAAMAFDENTQKIVMLGGRNGSNSLNDTWEFDGASWTGPFDTGAPFRQQHSLYFDVNAQKVVMFGGVNEIVANQNGLFAWNRAGGWTAIDATLPPPDARVDHAMIFDRVRGVGMLVGGNNGMAFGNLADSWDLDLRAGIAKWKETVSISNPPKISPPALITPSASAFDKLRGALILLVDEQTWEFKASAWRQTVAGPAVSSAPVMAFDSRRGITVLFAEPGVTAEYDGVRWQTLNPQTSPTALRPLAMDYDRTRSLMILIGANPSTGTIEPWSYNAANWAKLSTTGLPASQATDKHTLLFNSVKQQMMLFVHSVNAINAFLLDGSVWRSIVFQKPTPAMPDTLLTFDPVAQRVVALSDTVTWQLDEEDPAQNLWKWSKRFPSVTPPARRGGAIQYDSTRNRIVLFGGTNNANANLTDTWSYKFTSSLLPDLCIAGRDTDDDDLIACGGSNPLNPIEGADPDCYGRCFPLCPLPDATNPKAVCDVVMATPHCGDGICNRALEDKLMCPTDCP
jgi:cysteine-rich repeat protein